MNLNNIEELIDDDKIKDYILELIEYEQTQLHKEQPRYKNKYNQVIEEATNEVYKNQD